MKRFKQFLPPSLSVLNGKKYVVPSWIEVPMEMTLEEVTKYWDKETFENVPGRFATTEEIEGTAEYKILSSKKDKEYTVTHVNGHWSCDCVGYGYRRRCKHIDEAKKQT